MKYTKEVLEPLIKEVDSMASLMRKLNVSYVSGGMHAHFKHLIRRYDLNIDHWRGCGSNKGKFFPRKEINSILILRTGFFKEKTTILLRALLQAGVQYKCNKCHISEWAGNFIRLHVEHKNGNNMDNRLENLELLCPNCHSQTSTYGVLKKDRGRDGTGRRSGLKYGSLTEKLVRCMLLNSVNPLLATPSQASKEEGVETRQEPPKVNNDHGEGIVQTTNASAAVKTEVVSKIHWPQSHEGSNPSARTIPSWMIKDEVISSEERTRRYSRSQKTKIAWPSNDELKKMIWEKPTSIISKELGVSDKAINKRCKKFSIKKPGPGYWSRI